METILHTNPEALTCTREVWPVEEIKVRLLEFGKSDQTVNRTESRTEIKGSGLLLVDDDIKILAPGDKSILRRHVYLGKVVQVHQARLAKINESGVENTPWLHRQLPANHIILRF